MQRLHVIMQCLLVFSLVLCWFGYTEGQSNLDATVWLNATKCSVQSGFEGRCINIEFCPHGRKILEDPSCSKDPIICCESKAEDFIHKQYGQVAKQACNKYMGLRDWKLHGFIFNGKNARAQEFTFMAALGYGNISNVKFHCGGSLISEKHVLTAAHCLFSADDGPVRYILLGDLDTNDTMDDASPQYLYVQNVTVHPNYIRSSVYHDIAILHMNLPALFTPWVQPACLDFGQLPISGSDFYATGWGYIDTEGTKATHLQEVILVEIPLDRCIKAYPTNRRRLSMGLQETQICAAGKHERKDTCQGDSGGPLSIINRDIRLERYKGYILVGITSFGKLCGFTNAPGVYTKVEKYIPWIESVVWPEEVAASKQTTGQGAPQGVQLVSPIASQQASQETLQNNQPTPNNGLGNLQLGQAVTNAFNLNADNKVSSVHLPKLPGTSQVTVEVAMTVPSNPTQTMTNYYIPTTRKPVNLVDIYYFSDKK